MMRMAVVGGVDRVERNGHYAGKRQQEKPDRRARRTRPAAARSRSRPGSSQRRRPRPAGPTEDLVDMARRALRAHGDSVGLRPGWGGPFGVEMAGEVLLPGPAARIAATTFEDWLEAQPEGS